MSGPPVDLQEVVRALGDAGALFAYAHGSVPEGRAHAASDLDVAAFFGRTLDPWSLALPDRVDLLVLDGAPLELAGRVAQHGRLLLDADPARRVAWEAVTRKTYLDELPRRDRARQDFAAARRRG